MGHSKRRYKNHRKSFYKKDIEHNYKTGYEGGSGCNGGGKIGEGA